MHTFRDKTFFFFLHAFTFPVCGGASAQLYGALRVEQVEFTCAYACVLTVLFFGLRNVHSGI